MMLYTYNFSFKQLFCLYLQLKNWVLILMHYKVKTGETKSTQYRK